MGYLNNKELLNMGFNKLGNNVKLSKDARFYNTSKISIGSNVRIDDFVVISAGNGGIDIGSYVHIATHVSISGSSNITISDFAGLAAKCTILSNCDDFSGNYLSNPTVPSNFTNVTSLPIYIGKHVLIGVNSLILPGVNIVDGVSVGSFSLVKHNLTKIGIYGGIPCKYIKDKSTKIFELENIFLEKNNY